VLVGFILKPLPLLVTAFAQTPAIKKVMAVKYGFEEIAVKY